MTRCPACRSVQVVFRVGQVSTSCYYCGTSWIEQDGVQTQIREPEPPWPPVRTTALKPAGASTDRRTER
jgi:hypothetical protein